MSKREKIIYNAVIPIFCVIIGWFLNSFIFPRPNNYENTLSFVQLNSTPEELLLEAEKYFKMEEYNKAFSIYNLDVLASDPIALNNLAYLYENGIFVEQDIRYAKVLYEKAHQLGDVRCVDNWIKFNIKYPESLYGLVDNLIEAHELGSSVPDEFVKEFVYEEIPSDILLNELQTKNSVQLLQIFKNRMYEEELDDGLKDLVASDFIIEAKVETAAIQSIVGCYESTIQGDEELGSFQYSNKGEPLYCTRYISKLIYRKNVFTYTLQNTTQFIYIE